MKRLLRKILCLMLSVLSLAALTPRIGCAEEDVHFVILATSDLHGNVLGYSYEDDAETDNNGMARLYTYISRSRETGSPGKD